jgi:di/tricarboxylate transporter
MKIFVACSLVLLLILLIQNKFKPSILFGGLASIYYIFDLINLQDWSSSYTNSSLLVLVLLLVVSIALEKTFLVDYFSKLIISKKYNSSLLRLGFITAGFSAFLNNTAVVASLMTLIKNNQYHLPSKLLIPLSYFAIFGGTMTLIGTSTNLIVNSFVIENGLESLKMFDFLIVGGLITLFGIATIYFGQSLLPSYENTQDEPQEHLIEAKVTLNSPLIGKSIKQNNLRNLEYIFLLEIQRGDKVISPVSPNEIIETDDRLVFSGDIQHVDVLQKIDGLVLAGGVDINKLNLIDAIITPESTLVGQKVKEANFRSKFDAAIVSLKRGSQNISKIGEEVLQSGDRLVLSVGNDFYTRDNIAKNFYVLSNIKQNEKLSNMKSIFVVFGFIVSIGLSAIGILPLMKALVVFLAALLMMNAINIQDIKRRFPYEIFIIVGSSLAISKVILSSGLADDMASYIIYFFGTFGVYGSFISVYLLTLLLTEMITNNAAAALSFPIAYATALSLGVNPYPFIFAVAFGASASFMTPYGYQTNLMVSSLGGYQVKDFIKIGWIISLVYSLTVIIVVPLVFGF